MKLPNKSDVQAFLRRTTRPKTKLGKTTLWFGYLAAFLQALRLIFRPGANSMLTGWAGFIGVVFVFFAFLMGFRWVRRKLMWRLRNRLIVTYMFIGVIPVILLIAMALIAGYLFAGQFATYVAMSELQSDLQHLEATNRSMAYQFASMARNGKLTPELARDIATASDEHFRHRSVSVWEGDKGFVLSESVQVMKQGPIRPSTAFRNDFAGFVLDNNRLELRVMRRVEQGGHSLTVISDLPITRELLQSTSAELGSITLFPPEDSTNSQVFSAGSQAPTVQNKNKITVSVGDTKFNVSNQQGTGVVQAGKLPPATSVWDMLIRFGTRFALIEWTTGKSQDGLAVVDTRPSMLYATLFSTLGQKAGIFRDALIFIAIFFGVIELIALFIGVRLTRSMTKSVNELYKATEHVNRGDLQHRITVRTSDQMAALEQSFNSMTTSLATCSPSRRRSSAWRANWPLHTKCRRCSFPPI